MYTHAHARTRSNKKGKKKENETKRIVVHIDYAWAIDGAQMIDLGRVD